MTDMNEMERPAEEHGCLQDDDVQQGGYKGLSEETTGEAYDSPSDGDRKGESWSSGSSNTNQGRTTIYDLPEEILLSIFSLTSAYRDYKSLMLVCQQWNSVMAGSYPSPKASATLCAYKDSLILFGGWSHPTPYTFHQSSKFFNQLHIYSTSNNKWIQIETPSLNGPEGKAGHGATVIGDRMIVIGGHHGLGISSNDVWVLDLIRMDWRLQETTGTKPSPRFNHAQVALADGDHILVLGGCGGPNMLLTDAWLLSINVIGPWKWTELTVINPDQSAPQLMCHPACLVGDKLVILSKNSRITAPPSPAPPSPSSYSHPSQCRLHLQQVNQSNGSNEQLRTSPTLLNNSRETAADTHQSQASRGNSSQSQQYFERHPQQRYDTSDSDSDTHGRESARSGPLRHSGAHNRQMARSGANASNRKSNPNATCPNNNYNTTSPGNNTSPSDNPNASPSSSPVANPTNNHTSVLSEEASVREDGPSIEMGDEYDQSTLLSRDSCSSVSCSSTAIPCLPDHILSIPLGHESWTAGHGQSGSMTSKQLSELDQSLESDHSATGCSPLSDHSQSVTSDFSSNPAPGLFASTDTAVQAQHYPLLVQGCSGQQPKVPRQDVINPFTSSQQCSDTSTLTVNLLPQRGQNLIEKSQQLSMARVGLPSIRPNAMSNRQRQLDTLRQYEEKLCRNSIPQRASIGKVQNIAQGANHRQGVNMSFGSGVHNVGQGGAQGGNLAQARNMPLMEQGGNIQQGGIEDTEAWASSGFLNGGRSSRGGALNPQCHRCQVDGCATARQFRRYPPHPMYAHTLDIGEAVNHNRVTWLPVARGDLHGGEPPPDETIFYSLVEGRGELIMFGGIQGDMASMQRAVTQSKNVTNAVYYLSAKRL